MERDDDVPQPLRSHFSNLVERLQQSPKTAPSLRDQREAPDLDALSAALSLALQCVHDVLDGTNVEDELPSILHGFVDVFHKQMRKNDRALSAQAEAVRTLVMEQDGSEIASVNLEEATREGERLETLSEALTVGRDAAAVCFENLLGSAWVPHSGSKGKSALVTSAILDADDFLRKHGRGFDPRPRVGGDTRSDQQHHWSKRRGSSKIDGSWAEGCCSGSWSCPSEHLRASS